MASRRFNWGFLAMIALLLVAVITAVQWLLNLVFDGDLGSLTRIVDLIMWIAQLIGYVFVAIYAWDFASSKGNKNWRIVYWICIIIVLVFHVLHWVPIG